MESDIRLGLYLLPSWELAKELQLLRLVLKDQFGISAALRFMTHMTVKGFFLPEKNIDIDSLTAAVNPVIEKAEPFKLKPSGFRIDDVGCYLWFNPQDNKRLVDLHKKIIKELKPFISSGCDFSFSEEINDDFNPHMTLAMTDIPAGLKDEVIGFLDSVALEREVYNPGGLRLFEFRSEDWQKKKSHWIETLEWQILKSWKVNSCFLI